MQALFQDLRHGARILLRQPGFTLIAVLTLALGIGANTAIFSVVDAVLLRPAPYPEAGRLVFLWSTMDARGVPRSGSSMPDYREWRDQSRAFEGLAGFYYGDFNLSPGGGEPERVQGAYVTPNLFDVLRVAPRLGRPFAPGEDQFGRHRVALLGYGLWQRRFGGDPGVVGRTVGIGGEAYTVAGVMPEGMAFFDNLPAVELWTPIAFAPGNSLDTRNNYFVNLVGRLKPGVTVAQAREEANAIARRIEEQFPGGGLGAAVVPLQEQLVGDSRRALLVLLGAVAFVLLAACVNVASLLLVRAAAREQELAVRAALGASRARIALQMLLECLPLGALGGALGILLALWGIDLLTAMLPPSLPRHNEIGVSGRVLAFTSALSLLTVLIFGLLPARQVARADVREALNEGGRGGVGGRRQGRTRRLLVVTEIALALVLLVGAGLLARSFGKLRQVDTGFTARNVLTMRVALPEAKYPTPVSARDPRDPAALPFIERLLARVESLPGVEAATAGTLLPLGAGQGWGKNLSIEGRPAPPSLDQTPLVRFALISPDYFGALGIAVRRGRPFAAADRESTQPVAVINETFARRFFPGEDPVGKTIWLGVPEHLLPPDQQTPENHVPRRLIVGVVSDVKGGGLNQPPPPLVYAPLTQHRREGWSNTLMLAVRTAASPESLAAAIRAEVRALDPDQPVAQVRTVDELLRQSLAAARFNLVLLGLFAGVALALAGLGIYGVISHAAAQRTQEIGIRMALGAQERDVLRLVAKQGLMLAAGGVAAGLLASLALTRLMADLLFGVSATDPLTFVGIALLLILVALLACWVPARRAASTDPMIALRQG